MFYVLFGNWVVSYGGLVEFLLLVIFVVVLYICFGELVLWLLGIVICSGIGIDNCIGWVIYGELVDWFEFVDYFIDCFVVYGVGW